MDRTEAVLTGIYYVLGKIAETVGVDMEAAHKTASRPEAIRITTPRPLTPREQEILDEQETREGFAAILAQAKRFSQQVRL